MDMVRESLEAAVGGSDLSEAQAVAAMEEILRGEAPHELIAALLVALRMKGETVDEVTGFARAMRAHAQRVESPRLRPENLVDTCGTGGDGARTFNISTVSALVVAGAGAQVAKHGNRSISSRCGSADVLEALGVHVALSAEQAAQSIEETGIGFLFAPMIHPAMKHAQPARAALKMRTIFNVLGPLTNPASAGAQVVGVFQSSLVGIAAEALYRLGVRRAFVVHGSDGLDEITTTGVTLAAELFEGQVIERAVQPEDLGLPRAQMADLAGGDAAQNAKDVMTIVSGEKGPKRDIAVANAAAALVAAGRARDFLEGAAQAAESIDSGAARAKLEALIQFSNQFRGG